MLPADLSAASFRRYPPQAQRVALGHLAVLRQLPLAFLPSFLRELIEYDTRFPAERTAIDRQVAYLSALSPAELAGCFSGFSVLRVSPAQEAVDWVNQPLLFSEQYSAFLWSTNQMEAFRAAATAYGSLLDKVVAPAPPPIPRLGIAIIGQGARPGTTALFAQLRQHGTYFSAVEPTDGLADLLAAVEARAKAHPAPYAHWYVDGDVPLAHTAALTSVGYRSLSPVREALLARIQREVSRPGMGPEELRDTIARLSPAELGLAGDPVLDHFQVQLLTEGSGTQIFATTFAQWTGREILRRAGALTLLVRFAPRQRQRPMSELLASSKGEVELDPEGSLVDADMAAYYQWINQQRLAGADRSLFLAWFEGQRQAVAISPALPRGTESTSAVSLRRLLSLMETG